jgi:arylsulfatase A-like enzyme
MRGESLTERPNVILVVADQLRGDCLGAEGAHPVLTPNLDALAASGTRFTRAYSTCPVCIPARRSLISGQHPTTHGMVGYATKQDWDAPSTLPGVLRDAGYQTHLAGWSMRQHPERRRLGYDEMVIADDYRRWLHRRVPVETYHDPTEQQGGATYAGGIMHNDRTARPWPYAEDLHFTNWTVAQARRFLQRRDPSCPFFLTMGFLAPHPPLAPPPFYFERYLRTGVAEPVIGEWAEAPAGPTAVDSAAVRLDGEELRSARAGYYGLINHLDDQLRRVLYGRIDGFDVKNTIVIVTADHGEMLGDHYLWRKSLPYEGSVRIPLLVSGPGVAPGGVIDRPVCLEDVMPTVLDLVGAPIPDSVDGLSLAPFLRGESPRWRGRLHLEHARSFHALTDGRRKFAWFAGDGREQFFDLEADPAERCDLAGDPARRDEVDRWRRALIDELCDRREGFVADGRLQAGCDYPSMLPARGRQWPRTTKGQQ